MRIVLTGASGFLGDAVLKKMIACGFDCVGVSRGESPQYLRVEDYADSPAGDILIHLAEVNDRALANQLSWKYEYEANQTLHYLLKKGYKKVIYASTALLYGDRATMPRFETDLVSATDTYTRVKLTAEQSVLSHGGVVIRFSNIYGPGMSKNNVLSHILEQLGSSGPITLRDANPVRDFLWIEDAADAIMQMLGNSVRGVFNVGSGIGTSICGLGQEVLNVTRQNHREILSAETSYKTSCIILDITKAASELGWAPSVSLNEGLTRLVSLDKRVD